MDSIRSTLCLMIIAFFAAAGASAQTPSTSGAAVLARGVSGPYKILERSDWSRYENGKYLGHVYREVRSTVTPSGSSRGQTTEYRGDFLVLEETLRDLSKAARAVDAFVSAAFRVAADGRIDMVEDRGFPSLRGFPAFPPKPVAVGDRWTAQGVRAADPRNEGVITLVPLIAEYEYRGVEQYKGQAVHRIFAKYATRYKAAGKAAASFAAASGTHDVDILIRAADGLPLLIRDRLDETFTWADGSTTRFKGFTLTFSEGTTPLNRTEVAADLRGALAGKPAGKDEKKLPRKSSEQGVPASPPPKSAPQADAESGKTTKEKQSDRTVRSGPDSLADAGVFELAPAAAGIDVEPVEAGVKLTVRDVRFRSDSDEILAEERGRLDLIAEALKQAGDRTILVEGHTAAVGKREGELELSIRRAKRMADELSARGISADRFLYKGWGGTKPTAGNDTEEGRSRNRRVEITILE